MIVRRCSQGHRIRIHRNTTKGVTRKKTYKDGTVVRTAEDGTETVISGPTA